MAGHGSTGIDVVGQDRLMNLSLSRYHLQHSLLLSYNQGAGAIEVAAPQWVDRVGPRIHDEQIIFPEG
jgi:hypothetical protein